MTGPLSLVRIPASRTASSAPTLDTATTPRADTATNPGVEGAVAVTARARAGRTVRCAGISPSRVAPDARSCDGVVMVIGVPQLPGVI